ncbi:lysozyme [Sulfitobacter sp. M22]|uniref:lysozyme n=1 Tax=Sulfitobacter sp. M22 TaxID=2675332 RepID=UPI001F43C1FD|nr:lysozyme [Sulfitobacter sp. M22]MCF7728693.1 glycoside hydrolase family protein [Sulfitobacter sp. M22]
MSKFVDLLKRMFPPAKDGFECPKKVFPTSPFNIEFTAFDSLKSFEALRLKGYFATDNERKRGLVTIGWGHLCQNKEYAFGESITYETAEKLLSQDLEWAVTAVRQLVKVDLTQGQFNALVSFMFNVGRPNFTSSTLLKVLNAGQHDEVPAQLMRWVFQQGVKLTGLERRRLHEIDLWNADDAS